MTTTWKSGDKKPSNQEPNNTILGTMLSSWSRQQKLAMIAGFTILGLLLVVSACSKQDPKPALVGVSSPASSSATPATAVTAATIPTAAALPAPIFPESQRETPWKTRSCSAGTLRVWESVLPP